ncbi:MAG: phosphotransacetylase family protein [Chloroflexi bacterium]|nr:phosphotransacetylase family protein [Chloroflexota bacterium]
MTTLYVTSVAGAAGKPIRQAQGKTAICAGIGKNLLDQGKKVGYFKSGKADGDCAFMKRILGLEEPVESLSGDAAKSLAKVSAGKDVVIVEGSFDKLRTSQADAELATGLGAKVIIVVDYNDLSHPVSSYKDFGEGLLGVVVNKVPVNKVAQVRKDVSEKLTEAGITLLGVLPEDRALYALTVGELAESLQGKILNSEEQSGELVQNVMTGAWTLAPGPVYFGRKENKAAVIRSERPDMQLAALETSTRCLILTGETELFPAIRHSAETKKVPIISVKGDIASTVGAIDEAVAKSRFGQDKKLKRLSEIMGKNFDFKALAG